MIDANESRRGNYVFLNGKMIVVVHIAMGLIRYSHLGDLFDNGELKDVIPIPLSYDFALKLGFKQTSDTEFVFQPDPKKSLKIKLTWFEFSDSSLDGFYFKIDHPYDVHVKYVHQIQNIVFDLLRVELKFKN